MMVLVDGDRHGAGYITPIVCLQTKILVLPIRSFFCKSPHPLHKFTETDWSVEQSLPDIGEVSYSVYGPS